MKFEIGQTITTKKAHPCSSNQWTIIDVGIDIKIKCLKCGREVVIFKPELERKIKKI